MSGTLTLGESGPVDSALAYLRGKVADFRRLGYVELPQLRQNVTAVWIAATNAGDHELADKAHAEFDTVAQLQADWETNNERLEEILGPLDAVGIHLGIIAIPAYVAAVVVALAAAFVIIFRTWTDSNRRSCALAKEAAGKGVMPLAEASRICGEAGRSDWSSTVLVAVALGAGAYYLANRGRSRG